MTRRIALAAWLVGVMAALAAPAAAAPADEQPLIDILASDKPAAEKAAACKNLKVVGTARAVPALAALLADKDLSLWARYALESMPCPEAGAALRSALPKSAGLTKAGLIDSIGKRRDREAVAALADLARGTDAPVASAAAAALGQIGGKESVAALKAARDKAPAAAQTAVADALLLAADQFLAGGDKASAAAIYKDMYDSKGPEHVRTAAYRGMVLANDDQALALLTAALAGTDRASRRAALQLARQIQVAGATKALADAVAKVPPETQAPLIEALKQRGDPAAAPAIAAMMESPAPAVRIAAMEALAALGDASVAPRLAEAAAKTAGAEQDAARDALAAIRNPQVRDVLLAALPKALPAVQAEIARALGQRRDTQAVPALLKMAHDADDATRLAAVRSLAVLADSSAAADLIKLLLAAKNDAESEAVEQALARACTRGENRDAGAALVLGAMKGAAAPARAALLRVAGRIGGPAVMAALRAGLGDPEAAIRDAALRTLAAYGSPDAAADLLKLARDAAAPGDRVIALRGYWRLVGLAADRPLDERWKMCEAGLAAAQRADEKKLGLTELAGVPHPAALALAESLAKDDAVRSEAEAACVQIAAALVGTHRAEAVAALQRLAAARDEGVRTQAAKALEGMDRYVGFVNPWLVAGPYRQDGKQYNDLFDIAFPPEQAAGDVKWKPAPPPTDASLAWQVDLAGVVNGDQAVAYARTRVYSPREQKVRLEIGSDDGIKLWVNGKIVHAKNIARAVNAGDDKAEATLKEGWNDFLAKVTQNNQGCGLCLRIRGEDGKTLDGLRFDPAGAGKP